MKNFQKYLILGFFASILLFTSCQINKYTIEPDPKTLTIATFNSEWLGDGIEDTKPRTDADYEKIAKVISLTNADLIALQEVENDEALAKITLHLEGYSYYVAEGSGKQHTAFLFNNLLEFRLIGNYNPLAVNPERTRPGYIVYIKKGNFDLILMNVHLKSTSSYDNTEALRQESFQLRREQVEVLNHWVDSTLKTSKEQDIVITGDFNDNPKRMKNPTLTELVKNPNLIFTTANLTSCKNPKWDCIDHIIISKSASKRLIPNSVHQINFYQILRQTEAEKISDHCPVIESFDILAPDND